MTAMAVTEHGNVSSHVQLEQEARKAGIKPIYGLEAYLAPPKTRAKFHQTILAANEAGYRNLSALVTSSWRDSFYQSATISLDTLFEHSEGLVVLSGCLDSMLSCTLLGGKSFGPRREHVTEQDMRAAQELVEQYQEHFGDRYFLETQRFHQLERCRAINPALEELSRRTGARLVATADVHYPMPDDNEMQKVLHASHRGMKSVEQVESEWEYDILLTLPTSDREVYRDLVKSGLSQQAAKRAVLNTGRIARACTVTLPKDDRLRFPFPGSGRPGEQRTHTYRQVGGPFSSIEDYLWRQIRLGWRFRSSSNPNMKLRKGEYARRIQREMQVIGQKDFCDYFAVVADLISYAKDRKIGVGPGRGSSAGSLLCYLLRITEIDPILFPHMMFERFIDPQRSDMPDIDIDFDDERRDEARQYLVQVYGADQVGNVGNFVQYRGKNSIDDVARVHSLPFWEADTLKSMIIDREKSDPRINRTIEDTISMFDAAGDIVRRHPAFRKAQKLEGNIRGMSVHAAGIIVSNSPISDTCAVYTRTKAGSADPVAVLAYDKRDAEYLGMLKVDLLGLSTMGMIGRILDDVGMDLEDLYRVPLDDGPTLAAFAAEDLVGIFQFEGATTKAVLHKVQPDGFSQLADINALSRPGPLFSGMTDQYIEVRHDREDPESLHPVVDALTGWTNGQIVYQEQVLGIVRDLAGFSPDNVGRVRKIIGGSKGKQAMEELYVEFERGCRVTHGVEPELARKVWNFLVTSSAYSFCVTGDTVVEKAGRGPGSQEGDQFTTIEQLYELQEGWENLPMRNKIRSGRLSLLGMDDDERLRPHKLIKIHDPIPYKTSTITTDTGRSVRVSNDHLILTTEGYKHTLELKPGDMAFIGGTKAEREAERVQDNRHKGSLSGRVRKEDRVSKSGWHSKGFLSGEKNSGYIDGRHIAFRRAFQAVWDRDDGVCNHCGQTGGSIEVAHTMPLEFYGGDFSKYHQPENMLLLCNSCHKKYDYRVQGTRKRRWTVGRPMHTERIVSIVENAKPEFIYDVSMEGATHNYMGNGFIHHNNYSHSLGYAMLAYWCMYLKVHHPASFFAAQLAKTPDDVQNANKKARLLRDAIDHGVAVLQPSLALSGDQWTVADTPGGDPAVLGGFCQVPGIGAKTAERILAWREGALAQGREVEWRDLVEVSGIGPKTVDKIIAFAEDDDPFEVYRTREILEAVRRQTLTGSIPLPVPTHDSATLPREGTHPVVWCGMVKDIVFKDAVEGQRSRTGQSVDEVLEEMKDPHLRKHAVLKAYDDGADDVMVRVNRWRYPDLEDDIDSIAKNGDVIVVEGMLREGFGLSIHAKRMWVLSPG